MTKNKNKLYSNIPEWPPRHNRNPYEPVLRHCRNVKYTYIYINIINILFDKIIYKNSLTENQN